MAAPKGNQYAKGHGFGRPMKFESAELLETAVEVYFEECDETGRPYTVEGLASSLGMNRRTLLNYEKVAGYEKFSPIIREAKAKINANLVERALSGKNNSSITIFLLKNNYGYRDKTEHKIETNDFKVRFGDK